MAELIVIYKTPKDAAAFDKHYADIHIPLAKKIPGLRKYQITNGSVGSPAGPSDAYLIATLSFDSVAAIQSAFGTPEGQAAAADLGKFATGGVDMMFHETREV
jgi:uncharacterized protein (TIGR02118 family)